MKKVRLHPLVVFQKHGWSRTHGWTKVSQRSDRRAMAIDPTFIAAPQPRRAAARSLPSAGGQRHFVCEPHWLPMASVAARLSQLADGVPFVLALATVGLVAGDSRQAPRASASRGRSKSQAQRR